MEQTEAEKIVEEAKKSVGGQEPEKQKQIILTPQEGRAVVEMVHFALQNRGVEILEKGYILVKKIQSQF